MPNDSWKEIERIFAGAILLPEAEQNNYIAQQCHGDRDLYQQILSLINNDNSNNSFLNTPLFTSGLRLLDEDSDKLLESSQFAFYKLQKLIGRGGMGLVFLAEDTSLERLVAIKILPPAFIQNEEAILRFHQEAKAASNVSHQNIAQIYEFGKLKCQ